MACSLPNIVIKPYCVTLFHAIDSPLNVLPCPKTQEHQSTCVDSWVHRVPENGHQPLGRGIHYGVQLAQYCDQTLFKLHAISREIAASPGCAPLPYGLRNTKVPVWTHESIGYPKMDISHWDAAIHYGVQLAQYCDQRSLNAISREIAASPGWCPFCPKTQEHQSTCVDSWVHRVPENGHQPLGRGNSLWRAACPIGLWSNPIVTLFHWDCPLV